MITHGATRFDISSYGPTRTAGKGEGGNSLWPFLLLYLSVQASHGDRDTPCDVYDVSSSISRAGGKVLPVY